MPAERRSLRSNNKSDTSSPANGEKTRSGSQSSSSNKDKPTTRTAASKAKSTKAASTNTASDSGMGEQRDQPHTNGSDPTKNGVNGSEDIEMDEDTAGGPTSSFNASKDRKGDQKMTVVVPPTKGPRVTGEKGQEQEGDVSMEGAEDEEPGSEIDPKVKAIQGWLFFHRLNLWQALTKLFHNAAQTSRRILFSSNVRSPILTPGLRSAS